MARKQTSRLSPMDRDCIAWEYFQGFSQDYLAEQYGVEKSAASYWGQRRNVKNRTIQKLSEGSRHCLAYDYYRGYSIETLTSEYNIQPLVVKYWAKRLNVPKIAHYKNGCKIDTGGKHADGDSIAWEFYKGMSLRQVAKEFGVGKNTVDYWKKHKRVPDQRNLVATVDETKFDEINEESAYWLGFLMADGCVRKGKSGNDNYNLAINLAAIDLPHLYKLRSWLNSNAKISYAFGTNSYGLSIYSTTLAKKLMEYGIVPNKSQVAKCPSMFWDNKHFWRGMIDGDGHIDGQRFCITLDGTRDIVERFYDFAHIVSGTEANVKRKRNHYCIAIGGRKIATRLLIELYSNASIFLDRKYEEAMKVISFEKGCDK